MGSESIYEHHKNVREIKEGQSARQCEVASESPLTLLEQEQNERRARYGVMVAEKQKELAELKRQYEVSFAVLQDGRVSESDKQAAFILCDEIREEQKQVRTELNVLLASAKQSDVETPLTIPQDVYEDKSPNKPPFHFGRGKQQKRI